MPIRRVVVLGAGPVGGSVGALLAEQGTDVVLVERGAHGEAIAREGLRVRLPDRELHLDAPVAEGPHDVDWRDGDLVLLATGLHDALTALGELRAAAGATVPVACLTNGVQAEAWARGSFDTVLSTMVWTAASRLGPGVVRLHCRDPHGVLDTGGDRSLGEELSALLVGAGFDATWRRDVRPWKVAAWVTNLGGAAQALVDGDWPRVVAVARREGERVLARARVERVSMQVLLARTEHVGIEQVDGEVRGTGSTWHPAGPDRPLESEWIEGAMASLADRTGSAAPVNRLLATMAAEGRRLPATALLAAADPLDRDVTMS